VIGGDAIVHYELLTPNDSIFQNVGSKPVGYIRLTRFSKSSTAGYINAINSLEAAGANSYILDVRNNYGGVIQEAMLTASTLLRDPHQVLCYTLNSRGGFRPQENQEYITDKAYPGYFLSSEPRTVSIDQVRREHPEYLEDNGWSGPTSYASLRELKMTRGIRMAHVPRSDRYDSTSEDMKHSKEVDFAKLSEAISQSSQKKIVVLINEGTGESLATMLHAMSCYFLKANSILSFCL
jgi:C-terminal processing protease CtpA/Prc